MLSNMNKSTILTNKHCELNYYTMGESDNLAFQKFLRAFVRFFHSNLRNLSYVCVYVCLCECAFGGRGLNSRNDVLIEDKNNDKMSHKKNNSKLVWERSGT